MAHGCTVFTQSEAVVPAKAFGAKTIGMIPGLALNINNVTNFNLNTYRKHKQKARDPRRCMLAARSGLV